MLSSLARTSQEPKLRRIFEILWVLFEKISVFYSKWPKSWIWRNLGQVVNIFSYSHFHNPSKECFWSKIFLIFMHRFKSAILAKLINWHFWTRAWNSKICWAKSILLKHCENGNNFFFLQLVPGSAKSRIYAGKSTKRGFSKKGLTRIEIFFLF